ncbi:uncharacterized protein LOC135203716 [Macrobrachium nipponense]|uniref:uncharacterized protein LOC135203716 n=1 Tax=Macrobrachium nipponense TaxID=159736 RepID=UPI0030C80163
MNRQQHHTGRVSGDDLERQNGDGLPAQREDTPAANSDSDFEDDALHRNNNINSNQEDANGGYTTPMEIDLTTEDVYSENVSIMAQHIMSVISSEDKLATTQSNKKEVQVRKRITDKWICMFQIIGALEFHIEGGAETFEVMDTSEIAKVDNYLKGFFGAYNENIKGMTKHNFKVNQVLGSQYIYHAKNNVLTGVLVVVGGNGLVENLRLNSHLLLEKSDPFSPLLYKDHHNVYIGHAYPIHTEDVVCTGGNCLRDLLIKWVNKEFYERLHWIIPSTSTKMRLMSPKRAQAKEDEDLLLYKNLIKKMDEEVLRDFRKSLEETSTPRKKSQTIQPNSLYEYCNIQPGQECSVRSHHWQVFAVEVPLNRDNTVNDRAHRQVLAIRDKGGVVKKISE